jgi:putative phosphoesterase
MTKRIIRVGVLSDTHGHLPDGLAAAFGSVERIIHAGDIDQPQILDGLRAIAPLTAVRGNMDAGAWAERLPRFDMIQEGAICIYALHILERLDIDPIAAGVGVVVSGHSHQPHHEVQDGILYFNPGSACFPRHGSPASVGVLEIRGKAVEGRIIPL